MLSFYRSKIFWYCLFFSSLLPFVYIVYRAFFGDLGAEPAKVLVEYLGETAIIFLFITLSLSPAQKIVVFKGLIRHRRLLGLYAFFYASLHLLAYAFFLVDWQNFIEDIYQRLYVTMGFLAFVILLVLAITSPKAMLRKLGRRWKVLHRFVYLAAILVVIHVWWQVRSDYTEALTYASICVILFALRYREFKSLLFKVRKS